MRLEISVWLLAIFIFGGMLWASYICWRDTKETDDDAR